MTNAKEVDDKALELRRTGRSYAHIATELGLERATAAIAAFVRSVHRRPKAERAELLAEEKHRLDRLARQVRRKFPHDDEQRERRLRVVDRMRALVFAD